MEKAFTPDELKILRQIYDQEMRPTKTKWKKSYVEIWIDWKISIYFNPIFTNMLKLYPNSNEIITSY